MAEIHVQTKKNQGSSSTIWIWILVALVVIAAVVYFLMKNNNGNNQVAPANQTNSSSFIKSPVPLPEKTYWV